MGVAKRRVKRKTMAVVIVAVLLIAAAAFVSIKYYSVWQYNEKEVSIELSGDGSEGSFEGTFRLLPGRSSGEKWRIATGTLNIDETEYPVMMKMSLTYTGLHAVHLYNPDGSYFAMAMVSPDMDSVELHFVESEEKADYGADKVVRLKA